MTPTREGRATEISVIEAQQFYTEKVDSSVRTAAGDFISRVALLVRYIANGLKKVLGIV